MKIKIIGVSGLVVLVIFIAYISGRHSVMVPQDFLSNKEQSQVAVCANQAQIVLETRQKNKDPETAYSQTNHYNKVHNKCFIELVSFNYYDEGNSLVIEDRVMDAYEQKSYVTCLSGSVDKPYCFIPGSTSFTGQAVNLTEEEGRLKIRSYMND